MTANRTQATSPRQYDISDSAIFNLATRRPWCVQCEGSPDLWHFTSMEEAKAFVEGRGDGVLRRVSDGELAIERRWCAKAA